MRVLGIDPGTVRMGYGVLDEEDDMSFVACGVLEARAKDPIERRLLTLHRGVLGLLREYQPTAVAIEEPFVVLSPRNSAMAVGEARAIAMLAAAERDIPIFQYNPSKVRQTVANYGASTKEQVRDMVALLLNRSLDGYRLDACDALAVAICHLRQARLGVILGEQGVAADAGRRRTRGPRGKAQ